MKDPGARRYQPVDGEADLVAEFLPLAFAVARRYFIVGASPEDVRQEALIGLVIGIRDYDGTSKLPFFLGYAIERWLQSRVLLANRAKHRVLSESLRLQVEREDEDSEFDSAYLADMSLEPSMVAERNEEMRDLLAAVRTLSPLERRAFLMVANGEPYHVAGVKDKQVDNAVQRAKKKLRVAP